MTDTNPPSAEAMQAARRALSRFDRYGPTHGDLTHEIAVEIDAFAERRAAEAGSRGSDSNFGLAQRLAPYPDTPNVETHERIAAALTAAENGARRAAIEEAAQVIAPWFGEGHKLVRAIRALADKPAAGKGEL